MLCLLVSALLIQDRGRDLGYTGTEIESPDAMLQVGPWRAWLESPGGELPFALEITRAGEKLSATIGNGEERIAVPETHVVGDEIVFDMPHYDSRITARIAPLGTQLHGEWKKRSGVDRWTSLKFHAQSGAAERFQGQGSDDSAAVAGRWAVKFDSDADPAVAVLRSAPDGTVEGTFLTSTGDFRWLAGSCRGGVLRLSCFDGAHAFLFDAKLGADGRLAGGFWSGDRWHDVWAAARDPNAAIPDEFERAHWKEGFGLAQLLYPDLEGHERSLGEEAFAGRAMIIQVLGSWCPNCHDETAYLARVYDRYRERGLSVVGLAFEMTGDFARDSEQVHRMRERHKVAYPILLAGLSDKKKAAEALPALDHVLAFPTTIFLHRDGRVRAVHSGFAGPGTKEEHEKLAKRFEGIIEELLAEPDADDRATWDALTAQTWRGQVQDSTLRFLNDPSGKRRFESSDSIVMPGCGLYMQHEEEQVEYRPTKEVKLHRGDVGIRGPTVLLNGVPMHFDRRAGVLLDPADIANRFEPATRTGACSIDGSPSVEGADLLKYIANPDPLWRREATFYLAAVNKIRENSLSFDPRTSLADPDVLTRCTAGWACGQMRVKNAEVGLFELTKSGFAGERREAARALLSLHYDPDSEPLRSLRRDIDPLVRKAATR